MMTTLILLMWLKLIFYPLCLYPVFKIGKRLGFWSGWVYVTVGFALTETSVIMQLLTAYGVCDLAVFNSLNSFLSVGLLGIGFYKLMVIIENFMSGKK
jgi:hypothetical protein